MYEGYCMEGTDMSCTRCAVDVALHLRIACASLWKRVRIERMRDASGRRNIAIDVWLNSFG